MFKKPGVLFFGLFVTSLSVSWTAEAKLAELPDCDSKNGQALPIDNQRVVTLKFSTPNQFLERARVEGRVVRVLGSRPSHDHFEIQIGARKEDTLEVVFNRDFGNPAVKVGDEVEACGDYITSNAPTPRYKPSPSGAIIHWVHENSRGGSHPHGYVVVNDRLMHGFVRGVIEVDGSDEVEPAPPVDSIGAPSAPSAGPRPVAAPVAESSRPAKAEKKKERRPSAGKDDSEFEQKPRHGRNWRDWSDDASN